jgi:hypothetical protein
MVFNFVLVSSKILNVPMGESRSRPAQGRAVKYWYAPPALTQLRLRCRTILSILKGTHA